MFRGGGYFSIEHQKNFRRLLEILEVDVNRLQPIFHPAQFENIILPDSSFTPDSFTEEYRETIERVRDFALKNRTPTSTKKIYYFYGKNQFGEERLAEYFKSKGYEIISPERLTVDEQFNLLINAESFASTIGSCSHNSVFLRDDIEAILIPRAANRFTNYQQQLNQVHPINATYADSSLSILENFNGVYCFIISEQLKKFFGDEFNGCDEEDLKIFLTYMQYCAGRGCTPKKGVMEYYESIYRSFIEQLGKRKDLLEAFGVSIS